MKIYQIVTKSLDKPLYPIIGIDNSIYLDMFIFENRSNPSVHTERFFIERPSTLRILSYEEAEEKDSLPDIQPVENYWILSERGVDFLKLFDQSNFEFVKIGKHKEITYFSLNLISPLDVLDEYNSLIVLREDFRVKDWGVFTFLFKDQESVPPLFVLPYKVKHWFFCSEIFKYSIENSNLNFNGNFFLVWDSENPEYIDERFSVQRWIIEKNRFEQLKRNNELGKFRI